MKTVVDKPKVGDGATEICCSDCHAYTVVKVSPSGKTIWLQRDIATLLNGVDSGEPDALKCHPGGFAANIQGLQRYEFKRDTMGVIRKATLRKNGNEKYPYGIVGTSRSNVCIGVRNEYYDYNF